MAWAAPAGRITHARAAGGYTFAVAGDEDDLDIRALLRDNALGGWIRLSLEREPNAFIARALFDRHELLLVREQRRGDAIALCEYGVRRLYVNGSVTRVPYLGALRIDRRFRHRIGVLKHGFAAVRALLHDRADYATPLTAITADNEIAKRLLCAGVAGLPRYVPIGEMVTLAAPTRRTQLPREITPASKRDLPEIAALLKQTHARRNFAPVWEVEDLEQLADFGLTPERFLIARRHGRIVGCVAVWDQRGFKQTVVRSYAPWVQRARPIYNMAARLLRAPRLPQSGESLNQVFLSHLATEEDDDDLCRSLVSGGLSFARMLGAQLALIGMAATHPSLARLRRFTRAREYRTQLHLVQWPESPPAPAPAGLGQPEIA